MILSRQLKAVIGTILSLTPSATAECLFAKNKRGLRNRHHGVVHTLQGGKQGDGGEPDEGYDAVMEDVKEILTVSQEFFPADFADIGANYGPLMIRLAWHCAGSYRGTDGRGGCDGGRIRYDPELNWPDNANLDKALKILEPIKKKYGSKLSWGDLIILAGNAAIESMGGPILGFCGGRIDDADGSDSLILGPSDEQEELTPCVTDGDQGNCTGNLGPTTVGLIYVNPAGHQGEPDPSGQIIDDIRSTFGKMGMNDYETLALIGGGHAFGKCHGACANPPCGDGIGLNTFTSGFEGPWTTRPTTWTNEYFTNLFEYKWEVETGPGGNPQWAPFLNAGNDQPGPDIMMLTSDIALIKDDDFNKISREYANDISKLEDYFQKAWYKLTTSDMGPITRCLGDNVPLGQAFQSPLPPSDDDADLSYFPDVRKKIQALIDDDAATRGAFVDLAYKCGSTFRDTNHRGGCNGAFIRSDESVETQATIALLIPIEESSEASLADIIVLAGQVALEDAGGNAMDFCGGRTDAEDPSSRDDLKPVVYDSRLSAAVKAKVAMSIQGLTLSQGVALAGRPTGTDEADNSYFVELVELYESEGEATTETDEALVQDEELFAFVRLYAKNEKKFKEELADAWTYLMNADRFDGPTGNACSGVSTPTME